MSKVKEHIVPLDCNLYGLVATVGLASEDCYCSDLRPVFAPDGEDTPRDVKLRETAVSRNSAVRRCWQVADHADKVPAHETAERPTVFDPPEYRRMLESVGTVSVVDIAAAARKLHYRYARIVQERLHAQGMAV